MFPDGNNNLFPNSNDVSDKFLNLSQDEIANADKTEQ